MYSEPLKQFYCLLDQKTKTTDGKPHQCTSLADIIAELKAMHSIGTTTEISHKPSSSMNGCTSETSASPSEIAAPLVSPFQDFSSVAFSKCEHSHGGRSHSFTVDLAHIVDTHEVDIMPSIPMTLKVDGPFGAPVQCFKDYEVIMLVGAGIGVTPFASILSDLLQRTTSKPTKGSSLQGLRKLKKVYFHWSVRSQSEVMWFQRVLEAISRGDINNCLEINVHITGLHTGQDIRTMMLKVRDASMNLKLIIANRIIKTQSLTAMCIHQIRLQTNTSHGPQWNPESVYGGPCLVHPCVK